MSEDDQIHSRDNKLEHKSNVSNALSTLAVSIKDQNVLYATYMGFVKPDGGLFIPTKKEFSPGDRISLLLTIIDQQPYEIMGRVNWVTPKSVQGAKAPGIGIQFEGSKAEMLNAKIKQLLELKLQSDDPTYTM